MNKRNWSHYNWLDEHLPDFLEKIGNAAANAPWLIRAHGDKCYSNKGVWRKAGIPFSHGVSLYLLTYLSPWQDEVRQTKKGFIKPYLWVIENYEKFKPFLTTEDLEKVDD